MSVDSGSEWAATRAKVKAIAGRLVREFIVANSMSESRFRFAGADIDLNDNRETRPA
jgi:hypothetical protein